MSDQGEVSIKGSPESEVGKPKMVINAPDGAIIIDRSSPEERELLHRIAETLELITDRMGIKPQSQIPSYVITDHVPRNPTRDAGQPNVEVLGRRATDREASVEFVPRRANDHDVNVAVDRRRSTDHEMTVTAGKHHHHINWMYLTNIIFIVVMALSLIVPSILNLGFGIVLHPASIAHSEFSINRGDVLVTKLVPVTALAPKDLILISNDMTWDFDVHSIYAVSQTDTAGMTTVTETATGNLGVGDQYKIKSSTQIHKVTNVIPRVTKLAVTTQILYVKLATVLLVLLLNVISYSRKRRRRRAVWPH